MTYKDMKKRNREIYLLHKAGESNGNIGIKFDITDSRVSQIIEDMKQRKVDVRRSHRKPRKIEASRDKIQRLIVTVMTESGHGKASIFTVGSISDVETRVRSLLQTKADKVRELLDAGLISDELLDTLLNKKSLKNGNGSKAHIDLSPENRLAALDFSQHGR